MKVLRWSAMDSKARLETLARPAVRAPVDVRSIVSAVRADGDKALKNLTLEFDGVALEALRVAPEALEQSARQLTDEERSALDSAYASIRRFHELGRITAYAVETVPGVICRREIRPIEAVGLYVPGGSAPLPSTALMLGVPSQLAGCGTRVLCTPPRADGTVHPAILYAAQLCGLTEIFMVGGAQAIAAMAYGTETIPRVDKIFGPGNAWVTAAKQLVATEPGGAQIDMPAGPSELMVVADRSADPAFVAADLLSQAEHGPDSQVFFITSDAALAQSVAEQVALQIAALPRREVAEHALAASRVVVVDSDAMALGIVNAYAPEHLILAVEDAEAFLVGVRSAGSVFLGHWTPETLGDYCSGTNHVLPTYGYARAVSGLSVADFEKRITVQSAQPAGLAELGPVAEVLANMEGLQAHANAVRVRLARL